MIAEEWERFRRDVVPAEASAVQVEECKRAFYAGATALFYGIMRTLSPGPEPTTADEQIMEAIEGELTVFADTVRPPRGRA